MEEEKDPRVAGEQYLEKHKICQLLESLTAQLLFHKPDHPKAFLVQQLEVAKATKGAKPLLTDKDFHTMFGMFDVAKRGAITKEQASAALVSIMGPGASFDAAGLEPPALFKEDDFVGLMQKAVVMMAPLPYNFANKGPPPAGSQPW